MIGSLKKALLPDRPVKCPILFGPLRGARPLMNPQTSMRYILGLYEHELNGWLGRAIPRVDGLFDVGANLGFFCFGVMSAWRRQGKAGKVWAFEPQDEMIHLLRTAASWHETQGIELSIEACFVGDVEDEQTRALDSYIASQGIPAESLRAMVKIDVEGAEMKVLKGASRLVRDGNLFVIEVHSAALLEQVQAFFAEHNHPVEVVHQKPLPVIGRELRDLDNWWVVTKL